jgi:hypothetical protein
LTSVITILSGGDDAPEPPQDQPALLFAQIADLSQRTMEIAALTLAGPYLPLQAFPQEFITA